MHSRKVPSLISLNSKHTILIPRLYHHVVVTVYNPIQKMHTIMLATPFSGTESFVFEVLSVNQESITQHLAYLNTCYEDGKDFNVLLLLCFNEWTAPGAVTLSTDFHTRCPAVHPRDDQSYEPEPEP